MADGIKKINEYTVKNGRTFIFNDEESLNNIAPEYNKLPIGSLYFHNENDEYIFSLKNPNSTDWERLSISQLIAQRTINNLYLEQKTITANEIMDRTITGKQLALDTIGTEHLKDYCITTSKIDSKAITYNKLNDAIKNDIDRSIKLDSDGVIRANGRLIVNGDTTIKGTLGVEKKFTAGAESVFVREAIFGSNATVKGNLSCESIGYFSKGLHSYSDISSDGNATFRGVLNVYGNTGLHGEVYCDKSLQTGGNLYAKGQLISDNGIYTRNNIYTEQNITANGNISCNGVITASKVYNAVYNDLAEGYIPGEKLEPGDIVEIREDGKVYKAEYNSNKIVGVVSDEFADCYGASVKEIESGEKIAVGLIGKVHVKVKGSVKIGDPICCLEQGIGASFNGRKIGKALETKHENGIYKVLCLIYPN